MRIVIADDHPLVRSGARCVLGRGDQNVVVGEAGNGWDALHLISVLKPDLVTLDIEMPGITPEEFVSRAYEIHPPLRILVITGKDDEKTLSRFKKIRISGYLLKDEAPEHLLQAVRTISQGAVWFSQSIISKFLMPNPETLPYLTDREKQVLMKMASGESNQKISQDLFLAEQTVRNYATTIYSKIGVNSRIEAVFWARERCLVSA